MDGFQPGEGPSRGLLCDCIKTDGSFAALITAHLVKVDDVGPPRLQQLLLAVAPEHELAAVVQDVAAEAEEVGARDGDEDRVQVRHSV